MHLCAKENFTKYDLFYNSRHHFVIIFEHPWKILLCESFSVSLSLLVHVGGFRGEAYCRYNRLYNFREKKITDRNTNITHKNSSQFYMSIYSVHILIL